MICEAASVDNAATYAGRSAAETPVAAHAVRALGAAARWPPLLRRPCVPMPDAALEQEPTSH